MRLPEDRSSKGDRPALWETVKYAFPRTWSTGRGLCTLLAAGVVLAAALTPVSVVVLGLVVTEIQKLLSGEGRGFAAIVPWILVAGGAALVVAVSNVITQYSRQRLGDELSLKVEQDILRHASGLDLATLEDKETQDILDRAKREPGRNVLQFTEGLVKVAAAFIQMTGLVGILFWIAPFWSLLLVLLGLPFVFSKWYLSMIHFELKRNKTTSRRWTRYYANTLTQRDAVPSSKLLRLGPLMLDRHQARMGEILRANRRFYRLAASANLAAVSISIAVLMIAVLAVGRRAVAGDLGVGQFVAFWMAAWRLRAALGGLAAALSNVRDSQLSIANTREFLALAPILIDRGTVRPSAMRGEIRFSNVSFRYPRGKRPVIHGLSLCIRAGETVAIVGHNGAGKTTLAKLLARLYPVTEGEILIDGTSIGEFELAALYERMAFVFQRPTRYEATAFENVAFGDWRRLLKEPEKVRQIARMACVDEMIRQMPDGYDTLLGRMFGDHDLSGGQWQKLAIARALACEASIVILDEPAANLDVDSEYALYQGIRELIHDRTTILISHRFSTVRMADRIFVLDEGRLVEEGTHDQLLAKGGEYAAMCRIHEATFNMKGSAPVCRLPLPHTTVPADCQAVRQVGY